MSHVDLSQRHRTRREQVAVVAAVAVWLALVTCGWRAMTAYAYKAPGNDATNSVAATWPGDSQLPRSAGRSTLVVFLHPKCPCSRATLTELERVLIGPRGAVSPALQVIVVAATPRSPDAGWTATPLVERSGRLPAAHVFIDRGGVEANRFGASTSGTIMFYDADGRRRYCGGVTVARGHEGQSIGGATLARLIAGDGSSPASIPAFGCRLVSDHPCAAADEPQDPLASSGNLAIAIE